MKAPEPSYINIKLLGTKLDTKCDILARKAKVWEPIKKSSHIFKSKRIRAQHKIRVYKTYVEPLLLLLYNSETWTLTKTQEQSLDAFHRRLLRIALNYRYPKIIKNSHLYTLSKEIPVSEKIKKRRLALFGHILRLHQDTPAQKALDYYMIPCKSTVGHPPTTWLSVLPSKTKNPPISSTTILPAKFTRLLAATPRKLR